MGSTTPRQAVGFERKNKRVASGNRKPQLEGLPCCPCPLPTHHDGSRLLTPVKAHVPQCRGLELDTWCMHWESWLTPQSLSLIKTSLGSLPSQAPFTLGGAGGSCNRQIPGTPTLPAHGRGHGLHPSDLCHHLPENVSSHKLSEICFHSLCLSSFCPSFWQIFSSLRTQGYEKWDFLLCLQPFSCFY